MPTWQNAHVPAPLPTADTSPATPVGDAAGAADPAVPRVRTGLRLVLLVLLPALLGGAMLLWHPRWLITERLPEPWAEPVFLAVFAVSTLAFVPKPLLNLAAGALFGLPEGLLLAVLGSTLGAGLAFGTGRVLGRDALRPLLRGRAWRALDRGLTDRGFRAVLMLRLFPGMPFAVANYGAAISGVRLRTFLAATAVGVVPGTAAFVAAGHAAKSPDATSLLLSVGSFVVVAAISAVPYLRERRAGRRAG